MLNDQPMTSGYNLRYQRYKLIILDNGDQLYFDLQEDPYEKNNLDLNNLTNEQLISLNLLVSEELKIRS